MLQRLANGVSIAAIAGGVMVAAWLMPLPASGQDACSAVAGPARGVCRAYCGALDCPHGHGGQACDSLRKVWQKHTGSSQFPCDGPRTITCEPVMVTETHGDGLFVGNLQLGRVVNGKIPCAHSETAAVAECTFNPDEVRWLSSPAGTFVPLGQATSPGGAPGEYVTAGQVSAGGTLSCIEPTAGDSTGGASAIPLAGGCMAETLLSKDNEAGFPLVNFADLEVCSTDLVHPDAQFVGGPVNTRCFLNPKTSAVNCCWKGQGAALNDAGGRERDQNGRYLPETHHCHMAMVSSIYTIFVGKRPPFSTAGPIVWRPVSPQTFVANGGAAVSRCEPVTLTGLHSQGWTPVGGNARLARIENGKVPCLHKASVELAQCDFTTDSINFTDSGTWLQGPTGKYALIGQAVPLQAGSGAPDYIVAARMNAAGNVACTEPVTADTMGSAVPLERAASCVLETAFSSENATGRPLVNHANRIIRTSTTPHPDAHEGGPTALGCENGSCLYTGEGAALNDIFGMERDANGVYYSSTERCHMIAQEGVVVPGAKRALELTAPLQWLPVDPTVFYANGPTD